MLSTVLRSSILAASRNDLVRRTVAGAPVSRGVVARFIAGEGTDDAVRAALGGEGGRGGGGKDRPEPGTVDPARLTAADPDWAG